MGHFSSAVFYRPGTPPAVKASEVAKFLQQLRQTQFVNQPTLSADINWGDEISENAKPFQIEEDNSNTIHPKTWWQTLFRRQPSIEPLTTIKRIDPDFSYGSSFDRLIGKIENTSKTISRLHISGDLTDEQYNWFQVPHPSGKEINFRPDGWSLEFGEIELGILSGWNLSNGDEISELRVGMMSFSLEGYGYFYPWEFKKWVEKFTKAPGLQEVCDLCRNTWPVKSVPPSNELVMLRRECEEFWPDKDIHAPVDWAWGPRET